MFNLKYSYKKKLDRSTRRLLAGEESEPVEGLRTWYSQVAAKRLTYIWQGESRRGDELYRFASLTVTYPVIELRQTNVLR
jgi:hypothetical protein